MLKVCARADQLDISFADVVCINAFRGFLNEFVKKLENKELPEVEIKKHSVKRKKKKRTKEHTVVSMITSVTFSVFVLALSCKLSSYKLR